MVVWGVPHPIRFACWQICITSIVLVDIVLLIKCDESLLCRQIWVLRPLQQFPLTSPLSMPCGFCCCSHGGEPDWNTHFELLFDFCGDIVVEGPLKVAMITDILSLEAQKKYLSLEWNVLVKDILKLIVRIPLVTYSNSQKNMLCSLCYTHRYKNMIRIRKLKSNEVY